MNEEIETIDTFELTFTNGATCVIDVEPCYYGSEPYGLFGYSAKERLALWITEGRVHKGINLKHVMTFKKVSSRQVAIWRKVKRGWWIFATESWEREVLE